MKSLRWYDEAASRTDSMRSPGCLARALLLDYLLLAVGTAGFLVSAGFFARAVAFMPDTDLFLVTAAEVDFLKAMLLSKVLKAFAFVVLLDKADGEMSR